MSEIVANDILIIGVDPGLRNTAITAIHFDKGEKRLLHAQMLKSVGKSHKKYIPDSLVLEQIGRNLQKLIRQFAGWTTVVGVESVFHTKFLMSASQTAKVIGVCQYVSAQHWLPCIEISPPTVKKALGLSGKADKKEMVNRAETMLGTEFETHHLADSCGVAIALHLKIRRAQAENKKIDEIEL